MKMLIFSISLLFLTLTKQAYGGQAINYIGVKLDECNFKFIDYFYGRVNLHTESTPHSFSYIYEFKKKPQRFDISINFYCDSSPGMEMAFKKMGFIQIDEKWQLDSKEQPLSEEHMKFYLLNGKSWSGAAYTTEQTTGPYKRRSTQFAFCLSNKSQTLCGGSEMVGFTAYPKESALPKVLKLLQSTEFINSTEP